MKKWTWNDTDRAVFAIGAMAGAVFLIALCVFLVDAAKGEVQAWASWVQAIGSIGAVLGAFSVGRHQANAARQLQIESETRERRRVEEGYKSVILNLAAQAASIAKLVKKDDSAIFLSAWDSFLKPTADACLAALDALPMHDLGSGERIQCAFAIREEAQDFFGKISRIPRNEHTIGLFELFRTQEIPFLHSNLTAYVKDFRAAYGEKD